MSGVLYLPYLLNLILVFYKTVLTYLWLVCLSRMVCAIAMMDRSIYNVFMVSISFQNGLWYCNEGHVKCTYKFLSFIFTVTRFVFNIDLYLL
jgi:hypothetical protein